MLLVGKKTQIFEKLSALRLHQLYHLFLFFYKNTVEIISPAAAVGHKCTSSEIFKIHAKPLSNHNRAQLDALSQLSRDKNVVVKPSDKCKGLVLLNASEYVRKIEVITAGYEAIPRNPTPRLEATTKRAIHETMDGKVEERVIKAIIPHCSRTAELYGVPKDHKRDIPLRPIVSACDDPVDKLTWLLEKVVNQLLPHVPAHLKSTSHFLDQLSEQYPRGFQQGTILFSIDVVNPIRKTFLSRRLLMVP